jgi:hypothetical protein
MANWDGSQNEGSYPNQNSSNPHYLTNTSGSEFHPQTNTQNQNFASQGYPQGNVESNLQGNPQGNRQSNPQGNPQGFPQGYPQRYPQGYPQRQGMLVQDFGESMKGENSFLYGGWDLEMIQAPNIIPRNFDPTIHPQWKQCYGTDQFVEPGGKSIAWWEPVRGIAYFYNRGYLKKHPTLHGVSMFVDDPDYNPWPKKEG